MTEKHQTRIVERTTQSTFFNIEDALEIGKLRIYAGLYRNGQVTARAQHYFDLATALVLLNDLSWGKSVELVDYKGIVKAGVATSRAIRVNCKDDKVYFKLKVGPGQVVGKGAVKPDPTAKPDDFVVVNIGIDKEEARKIAYRVLLYIQGWQAKQMLWQMFASQMQTKSAPYVHPQSDKVTVHPQKQLPKPNTHQQERKPDGKAHSRIGLAMINADLFG